MCMQTQTIYVIISIERDLCSKQVYIQTLRQGMMHQNQVPNSCNGELL